MTRMFFVCMVFLPMCIATISHSGVPEYTVLRATNPIVIDGVLDEQDWEKAQSFVPFTFPWWESGEKEQTEVKMLWDDTFLYLAYHCDDTHIWADHYTTNTATCLDDCVELFWNPNPEANGEYNMFEINCIGNLLSIYNNLKTSTRFTIMVPHIAQTIDGTINNDADSDKGWTLEVAIRFSDYPNLMKKSHPAHGDVWRIGLNRCGGKTNPQYSQWSPSQTPQPNYHSPEDFGKIIFSEKPVR